MVTYPLERAEVNVNSTNKSRGPFSRTPAKREKDRAGWVGKMICAKPGPVGNSGRALDSIRRGDSVPGLTLVYSAGDRRRILQMGDFF